MSSERYHMWSYWRDKRGSARDALENDYPELLGKSLLLRTALAQIRVAEAAIDQLMSQLEDDEDQDEG